MGKRNGRYNADFPIGTIVQIADIEFLGTFLRDWKYHNPLLQNQLEFAGQTAEVVSVSFYHGGNELYTLKDIPGVWHEECLAGAGNP